MVILCTVEESLNQVSRLVNRYIKTEGVLCTVEESLNQVSRLVNRYIKTEGDFMQELNKFEKTRVLSARALQISDGAKVYLKKSTKKINSLELALEEFGEGKTPLKVVREK